MFRGSKKQSKEAKKRMDHLMYLGKERPDNIYDLSDCEISKIPSEVFSLCKVLRKESLLLHTNHLKSLKCEENLSNLANLRILDLHENKIAKLPPEIKQLKCLQILNVANNCIAAFPPELCQLTHLQTLSAKDNKLNCLPRDIGNMSSLRTVDISGSNQVFYLPKSLANVRSLEVLLLTKISSMEYPAPFICEKGLEEIKKTLCRDIGIEYAPPSHDLLRVLTNQNEDNNCNHQSDPDDGIVIETEQADASVNKQVMEYEKLKDQKRQQQLAMERELAESQMKEAQLAMKSIADRNNDTNNIIKENENFKKMFQQQQEEITRKRKQMIDIVSSAESDANSLVDRLLKDKARAEHREELLKQMEEERLQQEEYFRVTQADIKQLRKKETVDAMNLMLQDDSHAIALVEKYLKERDATILQTRGSLSAEAEILNHELDVQNISKKNLVEEILEQEELQMAAFAALQMSVDEKHNRIMSQIKEVEEELRKLTSVEFMRKKMKVDLEQEILSNERRQLSDLLMMLLKEKDEREKDLRKLQVEMEQQRENDQIDFWLVQYQRLLDSKPEGLINRQSEMQIEVIKLLTKAGAEHHVPSFSRHKINTAYMLAQLTDEEIMKIGVFEIGVRKNIMRLIEEEVMPRLKKMTLDDEEKKSEKIVPLEPLHPEESTTSIPGTSLEPIAPAEEAESALDNECVICMDKQSNCVLLPCGHVCSCSDCVNQLATCPMCRATITQKIRLYKS